MAEFYHNDEVYIDIDEDLDFSSDRPYHDYYDDDKLGAFNEDLATLIGHLQQAVAKGIKDELESLREENAELRDIKEDHVVSEIEIVRYYYLKVFLEILKRVELYLT